MGSRGDRWSSTTWTVPDAQAVVAGNPDVDAFALRSRVPAIVDGRDLPLYSLLNLQGSLRFVLMSGRAPDGDDELALGPRSSSLLGVGVGDTVRVGPSARMMNVVGISLLAQTPHTSFDEGAWLTPNGLDSATGTVCCTGERPDEGLLRLRRRRLGRGRGRGPVSQGPVDHHARGAARRHQPAHRAQPAAVPRRLPAPPGGRCRGPRLAHRGAVPLSRPGGAARPRPDALAGGLLRHVASRLHRRDRAAHRHPSRSPASAARSGTSWPTPSPSSTSAPSPAPCW